MNGHTPGPWSIQGRYVHALKEKFVAELPCGGVRHGKVDEANALLIAAAPDLLAALKHEQMCGLCHEDGCLECDACMTNAAIAKAEGK